MKARSISLLSWSLLLGFGMGVSANQQTQENDWSTHTRCSKKFNCDTVDIRTSAKVVATKSLNRMPVDPDADFPVNILSLTDEEREQYRKLFVKGQAKVFGEPVGWKLALGTATPATPALGYTQPAIGQLLSRMIIRGSDVKIRNNYAVLPIYEVDLVFRVKSSAINHATTYEDIVRNIDGVYPFYELPAGYVPTILDLAGPLLGGNSLLPMLNGAARLGVLGKRIPVPGKLCTADWVARLSDIAGEELVIKSSGNILRVFNNLNFLQFALTLIQQLNLRGLKARAGDILSLGNLTGTNLFDGTEEEMIARYDNIDPKGPVTLRLLVDNVNGLCIAKK